MEITRFVGAAWLIAQLIHAVIILILSSIFSEEAGGQAGAMVVAAGFIFSVPAMALCIPLLKAIRSVRAAVVIKFILWVLVIALSLVGSHWMISRLFFTMEVFSLLLICSVPGFFAAVIASFLLHKSFEEAVSTPQVDSMPDEWEELNKMPQTS